MPELKTSQLRKDYRKTNRDIKGKILLSDGRLMTPYNSRVKKPSLLG